jgi:hypothetical protein
MNKAATKICAQVFNEHMFSILLSKYQKVHLMNHMVKVSSALLESAKLSCRVALLFHILTCNERLLLVNIFSNTVLLMFWTWATLAGV